MKRITLGSWLLFAVLAVVVGCKSGPGFAWFKREKAPEDSSAVARSAKPALPSSQSTPQPAAVAGLTPAAPPSSTNLAAASTPATGALGALGTTTAPATTKPVTPPPAAVPVSPSTAMAAAPTTTFPSDNGLADKLVSTPKSATTATPLAGTAATATTASTPATPPMVAAGPYDPSAYKPSAVSTSDIASSNSAGADRYAVAAGSAGATSPSIVATAPTSLVSDPADRYGSRAVVTPAPVPAGPPITDPAAIAADRYANPPIPTLPATPAATQSAVISAPAAPATAIPATPTTGVRLASAPGQYRPGKTSTYVTTSATVPIEIASRPAPPSSPAATAVPPASTSTPSQSWSPPATAPTGGTRTY